MYSLTPLENVTFDPHIGFWITVIVVSVFIGRGIYEGVLDFVTFILLAILITVVGLVSFTDPVVYPNTEVTGKFIGYTPEEQSYRCGKNNTCYTNKIFAEFEVPEGIIVLQINPAYPIPKFVKLYKN